MSRYLPNIGTRVHHGHVVAFAALLAPMVAVVSPLGLAPVLGVLAIVVLGFRRARFGTWFSRPNKISIIVGILFAWILASYFWSIDANAFTDKVPRLFGILLAGVVFLDGSGDLDLDAKRLVRRMLVLGVIIGFALVFIDRFSDASIQRLVLAESLDRVLPFSSLNRTVTVLALMIWPAVLAIWRQRPVLAIMAWVVSLAIIVSFESNAAIAGLLIGGVVFALVLWGPKWTAAAIGVAVAALILLSAQVPTWLPDQAALKQHQEMITNSGYHRLLIWKFVAEKIAERPLLGWGFNTSRSIPGSKRDLDFAAAALPLHPHNAALQLWLELGVPGAALGAVLIAMILSRIGRMAAAKFDKAASAGLVLSVATIGNLSYGVWQSWWLATIWLVACFMCVAIEPAGGEIDRVR